MTLYLHIGMNKTGTSALQRFMFHNRVPLAAAGLIYPTTGLGTKNEGAGMHYGLSKAFIDKAPHAGNLAKRLLSELAEAKAGAALVSSEFFVNLKNLSPLTQALADVDTRIVVYLRRHDLWVNSLFAQAIKTMECPPWGPRVEDFIAYQRQKSAHYFQYSRLLDRWASAFGRENVIVRPYGAGAAVDIVADMCDLIGLDARLVDSLPPATARINRSPSRRQLAAIDHIQRAKLAPDRRRKIVESILKRDDSSRTRQLMTGATAQALIDENTEDYRRIARDYLGRDDGNLFHDPLPEPGGRDKIALWPGEGITVLSELLGDVLTAETRR